MDKALESLCRAVHGDTAKRNLALFANHRTSTARADRWHLKFHGACRSQRKHGPYDLRDYISCLVHDDGIPHADVFAVHLVDVVQRGPGDRGAGNDDRIELGDWCEHAGTSDLHADVPQDRALFFRGKLEGNGPARSTRGEAKRLLLSKGVDLHDDAVDVVVEVLAMLQRPRAEVVHLLRLRAALGVRVHMKAAVAQPCEEGPLARDGKGTFVSNGINEGLKIPSSCYLGIFLAEAACGRVAGICERREARSIRIFIEPHKRMLGHVHLAAHLYGAAQAAVGYARKPCFGDRARHVLDRQDVSRHVFARGAVAACRRADELPVAVGKRNAQTVDLQLAGKGDGIQRRCGERLLCAAEPLVELAESHRVVNRVHALGVADGGELPVYVAADTLGVGIRRYQLRMLSLD